MNELGSRIRRLRVSQQRTLLDVARPCGFTVSLLSKIESGKITPPLATLAKIASALGLTLGNLLEGKQDAISVVTQAGELANSPPTRTDKGYGFYLLAGERTEKIMQPFIFVAERGKIKRRAMAHCGEEFIYVLEGRMRYRVGNLSYTLGAGDSLYFSSEEEHDLEPLTPFVRYLGLFAERVQSTVVASNRPAKSSKHNRKSKSA